MTVERFQERLRDLLKQHDDMTQYQLAKMAGVSSATVSKWLTSLKTLPTYPKLKKIAGAFGMTVSELMEEKHVDYTVDGLPQGAEILIENYRKMDRQQRIRFMKMSEVMAHEYPAG